MGVKSTVLPSDIVSTLDDVFKLNVWSPSPARSTVLPLLMLSSLVPSQDSVWVSVLTFASSASMVAMLPCIIVILDWLDSLQAYFNPYQNPPSCQPFTLYLQNFQNKLCNFK